MASRHSFVTILFLRDEDRWTVLRLHGDEAFTFRYECGEPQPIVTMAQVQDRGTWNGPMAYHLLKAFSPAAADAVRMDERGIYAGKAMDSAAIITTVKLTEIGSDTWAECPVLPEPRSSVEEGKEQA